MNVQPYLKHTIIPYDILQDHTDMYENNDQTELLIDENTQSGDKSDVTPKS